MAEIAVVCENKIIGWLPRPEHRADVVVFNLCETAASMGLTADERSNPFSLALIALPKIALRIVAFWIDDQGEIVGRCEDTPGGSYWRMDFMILAYPELFADISKIRGWRRAAPQRIIDLTPNL